MGTKVKIDSYMPEHCSMRDLNGSSWPYYGENNFPNGPFYYGLLPNTTSDSHPGYDKDVMKQTALEHEAVLKNRAFELHQHHQVQRDLMNEVRTKDRTKCPIPYEGSSPSSTMPFQLQHEDVQRWNGPTPRLSNFVINRPIPTTPSPSQNRCRTKDAELSSSRPTKVRRKMLDLQLPAYEYIDLDEVDQRGDVKVVNNTTSVPYKNGKSVLNYPVKTECREDALRSDSRVDLNEPLYVEDTTVSSLGFLGIAPSTGIVGPTKLSQMSYVEKHKRSARSINKGTPCTSSQPMRGPLNRFTQPLPFLTCDQIKGDLGNLEKSDKKCSLSRYNMPGSVLSSHGPNQPSPFYPSDLGKTRDRCGSSSSPYLNSSGLTKSHRSSTRTDDLFGNNKWDLNNVPGNTTPLVGEVPSMKNGFYQGSSSSIKQRFDYHDKSVRVKDLNLNVPLSDGVSDCRTTDPLVSLPWLRGNNHTGKAEKSESSDVLDSRKIFGVPLFEGLLAPKKENMTLISSSDIDHRSVKEEVENSWRKGGFDMNLPCEVSDSELDTVNVEVIPTEKRTRNESANVRNCFDLNLCDTGIDLEAPVMVDSDEDVLVEEVREEEIQPERADNEEAELATSAAEIIVAMSSSVTQNHQSLIEPTCVPPGEEEMLRWFVDVACSSGHGDESHTILDPTVDNRGRDRDRLPEEGLDEYECMVLKLKECDVEEYFPKPFIPVFLNIEGNGSRALTRTRKRHGRRGRQRRDFQRDILPVLTSLSKNEVNDDLQTCGRLIRDTLHPRDSNGCGRGRRRSVVVPPAPEDTGFSPSKKISSSNTEVVVSEDRCLTGWGKTTRRPRRQRCIAGNSPPCLPLR